MSAAETAAATAQPSRRWPAWLPVALLLVIGLVVFLPAIRSPRFLDDYFQTSMLEGTFPAPRSPFDLYNFVGDADRSLLLDRGLLPWWTHPRLTVRFLRPLSSALRYVDYRALGNLPVPSHLHSFAWWAAAALAARALYRRVLPGRAALLATFVFALAPCHAVPLVWLANREALVSGAFGILGLGALVRYREAGRAGHLAAATLLFALSLLGGEYALCFGGYALAFAIADRPSPPLRRLAALLSFAVPAVVYVAVRARLGYGAEGSGLYYDPLRNPVVYLQHFPRRLVTLLAESWLTIDPGALDPWTPAWILGLLALVGVAMLVVPLRRVLEGLDDDGKAHVRWLLLGSVLSLAPVISVLPAPRVLGASWLGVAATVALIFERAWFPPAPEPRAGAPEITGLVALVLGFAHLVHGPLTTWITCRNCRSEGIVFAEHAAQLRERAGDPASADVVVVRGLGGTVFVLPYSLDDKGTPPKRWRLLALTGHVLALRPDARTLDLVVPRDAGIFHVGEGNLFRSEELPFAPGDTVSIPGMRATVLEVGRAGPHRVRFEFDEPLESPAYTWVNERFDGIYRATVPEPGFGKPFDPWPRPEERDAR